MLSTIALNPIVKNIATKLSTKQAAFAKFRKMETQPQETRKKQEVRSSSQTTRLSQGGACSSNTFQALIGTFDSRPSPTSTSVSGRVADSVPGTPVVSCVHTDKDVASQNPVVEIPIVPETEPRIISVELDDHVDGPDQMRITTTIPTEAAHAASHGSPEQHDARISDIDGVPSDFAALSDFQQRFVSGYLTDREIVELASDERYATVGAELQDVNAIVPWHISKTSVCCAIL